MRKVRARTNPNILRWAREDAGFDVAVAARKASVAEEKLIAWEDGSDQPTIPQLRNLAQIYKRPLAVFYLPEVPQGFRVQSDFRRLPGEVAGVYSPELRQDLRNAAYHREIALDLYNELGEKPPSFRFSISIDEDPERAGDRIRHFLAVEASLREDSRLAFNRWRRLVESKNVLVFQMARVAVQEMRGFSLASEFLPVIAVNRKDAWAGRLFSLLHELAHIALRRGGICDIDDFAERPAEEQAIEQYCNHAAGAALVPKDMLLAHVAVRAVGSYDWDDDSLKSIAGDFGVSREVILRRLLILGQTSTAFYRESRDRFLREYVEREEGDVYEKSSFARNMPRETVGLLGQPYVGLVLDTYAQDRITLSDVATYLGVRVKHLDGIARLMRAQ